MPVLRALDRLRGALMAATTTAFEAELLALTTTKTEIGLCASPAYRLRQNYLEGMVDPAAHTDALINTKWVDALSRQGKTASFAAITAV